MISPRQLASLAAALAHHATCGWQERAHAAEARLARAEQSLKEYTDHNAQLARALTDARLEAAKARRRPTSAATTSTPGSSTT